MAMFYHALLTDFVLGYWSFLSVIVSEWVSPTRHIVGHFGDNFYRPDEQANSVIYV